MLSASVRGVEGKDLVPRYWVREKCAWKNNTICSVRPRETNLFPLAYRGRTLR
jgi:hypothetical protein